MGHRQVMGTAEQGRVGRVGFYSFAAGSLCQLGESPWRAEQTAAERGPSYSNVNGLLEIETGYTR